MCFDWCSPLILPCCVQYVQFLSALYFLFCTLTWTKLFFFLLCNDWICTATRVYKPDGFNPFCHDYVPILYVYISSLLYLPYVCIFYVYAIMTKKIKFKFYTWNHDAKKKKNMSCYIGQLFSPPGERFKNVFELLNLRALKISMLGQNHIFQCMGKMFCVEFQRVPLKFRTKYLTHTLNDVDFICRWKFKSS